MKQVERVENAAKDYQIIEAKTKGGETALIKAAQAGSFDCVKYLIIKGANKTAKDNLGRTALDYAKILNKNKALI